MVLALCSISSRGGTWAESHRGRVSVAQLTLPMVQPGVASTEREVPALTDTPPVSGCVRGLALALQMGAVGRL